MILPFSCFLIGVIIGKFSGIGDSLPVDALISGSLYAVVFCAGTEVGAKRDVLRRVGRHGPKVLIIPAATALGSVAAAMALGPMLGYAQGEAASIGAGFGYYSLSSGLLAELGAAELAPLAFVANVFREILSLLFIPIIARIFGHYAAVAPAGATSMDTTLGVISASTSEEVTVLAMINGIILTVAVPLLIPVLYRCL